ncbi:1-deoxy-D-xylulose-5-phosphate synthase [Helicobacter saguini]
MRDKKLLTINNFTQNMESNFFNSPQTLPNIANAKEDSINAKSNDFTQFNRVDSTQCNETTHTKSYESTQNITQKLLNSENIAPLLQNATSKELQEIAQIIRDRILQVVSKNGGHLSSTLGAVELIIGMHAVFPCEQNPFIFDVSHQAYAHKLLTGRFKDFESLRQFQGLSGFIAPSESAADYFIAGHSSTSLSLGVGVAKAKILSGKNSQKSGQNEKPIIMIGDGAMSAGLVYEALNEIGERKLPMVIVLNDNEMSIAKPIGAISKILSKSVTSPLYQTFKQKIKKIVDKMPDGTAFIAKRFEESFKLISPGLLFEEFGLDYIGPIDGNNLDEVIKTLKSVKNLHTPVIIHAQTIKGKGYKIAEGKYEKWHGVAPFDIESGKALSSVTLISPTATFSNTLLKMASLDSKIVGVTAAMPSGTGLDKLMDTFPERFFDVAIAEQHAVTSMAAMAREGFKPYIAIYSTFLQRAFDQIVHDVCIMNLPCVFCIDRAGLVGEDGETHQGLLDISYLKALPNIALLAPRSNKMLESMLESSVATKGPLAIRYPRGKFLYDYFLHTYENANIDSLEYQILQYLQNLDSKISNNFNEMFKPEMIIDSKFWENFTHNNIDSKILIVGYGNGVGRGIFTILELQKNHNIKANLLDLKSIKPLDSNALKPYFSSYDFIFVLSDSYKINGVGEALLSLANELDSKKVSKIITFEIKDAFIKHGKTELIEQSLGLDSKTLAKNIANFSCN